MNIRVLFDSSFVLVDDKLTRIRPIIDHVTTVSTDLFQPYEKIAVDERIVKSKHKYSGIRQFMKDKPVKFGIKLWVLADTLTGFTCNFFVYLGKKRTEITDLSKGLAYAVVMYLTPEYFNQGYRLFMDSFYTTFNLANDLLKKLVYVIGAIRQNSSAMPLLFKVNDGWEKVAGRGDFRWHRERNFLTVQWKDCKTVTIISPIHKGCKLSTCTRTFKGRTGWKKQCVKQPDCVKSYNEGMFGVDKSNQYLSRYPCYVKSKFHWWKVLFFHCLDIMVVNSFIVFQEFRSEFSSQCEKMPAHFGQLEFREYLVKSLLGLDNKYNDVTDSFSSCMPICNENSTRLRCTYCYAYAKLHGLPASHCKTIFRCEKCMVNLCLSADRNCFKLWHSDSGKEVRYWVKENGRNKDL